MNLSELELTSAIAFSLERFLGTNIEVYVNLPTLKKGDFCVIIGWLPGFKQKKNEIKRASPKLPYQGSEPLISGNLRIEEYRI